MVTKNKLVTILVILTALTSMTLITILTGCITKGVARSNTEQSKASIVFIEEAKKKEIADVLSYPVRLMPISYSVIFAENDGVVEKIKANLGKSVKADEEVVIIKHTDPVYHYAPMALTSPIKGVVSSIEVNEGSRVQKGQKIGAIADTTKLKGVMEIAAADLGRFKQGLSGSLTVPGTSEELSVNITGISPMIDPATGTASCDLVINKKGANGAGISGDLLPAGTIGRAAFKVNTHQGIEVPEHIVIYKGKDTFLRLVENSKVKLVPVTLGSNRQGFLEVLKGLDQGTLLIMRANAYVADGEEVIIQNPEVAKK